MQRSSQLSFFFLSADFFLFTNNLGFKFSDSLDFSLKVAVKDPY